MVGDQIPSAGASPSSKGNVRREAMEKGWRVRVIKSKDIKGDEIGGP